MNKTILLFAALCLLFASCEKQTAAGGQEPSGNETDLPGGQEEQYPDPICTYAFDGQEHGLYTALYHADDTAYYFMFSPFSYERGEELTTYFYFVLLKEMAGLKWDVKKLYHNSIYYFAYEDPVRFYSQYRELQGGTMFVKSNGGSNFTVTLDIALADGTPLYLDYTGEFAPFSE